MSFQHFRLGELPLHPPIQQQSSSSAISTISTTKQPYGSGDTDDGYTLVFPNLAAFQDWRNAEEERHCVEFVKGDTHGSKADPPRFKDHTKLVCARHSRSGRKKYVKKHPERVRKVPSRKLDGQGCQASISYKTYFETEEVRACYISQHSHEIGPANLPYTRRGRKAAVQQEKERGQNKSVVNSDQDHQMASSSSNAPVGNEENLSSFNSAVSMLAPLPGQSFAPPPSAQPYGYTPTINAFAPPPPPPAAAQSQQNVAHERWENMATLFQTVRDHARAFEYPAASVAALETVLIRLYLESPMGLGPQQTMGALMLNQLSRNQQQGVMPGAGGAHQPSMNGNIQTESVSVSNAEGSS